MFFRSRSIQALSLIATIFLFGGVQQASAQMPGVVLPPTSPYTYDGATQAQTSAANAINAALATDTTQVVPKLNAITADLDWWFMANAVLADPNETIIIKGVALNLAIQCDTLWSEGHAARANGDTSVATANTAAGKGDAELSLAHYYLAITEYNAATLSGGVATSYYTTAAGKFDELMAKLTALHLIYD